MSFSALKSTASLVHCVLARRPGRYTPAEVIAQLAPRGATTTQPGRSRAILACAAQPSEWMDRLDARTAWQLGRLAPRLPTVVAWYGAGLSFKEIGKRIGSLGGSWTARRALEAAACCISARLNDDSAPAVWGAA